MRKSESWKCVSLPSSQIFWASVQKAIFGSSKWKRAHDFERKFGPWKQASVIWFPCKLIDPPNCIPSSGNGIWNKDMWHPDTTFNTPGQCRWWAASSTARKQKTTYPEISHEHPECWVGRQQVATFYSWSDSDNRWKQQFSPWLTLSRS